MNKTIGILAHVDAGKTTFAEQLLFYTNSIKQRGRVDHQDAFLDSHQIERERGITVFADQAMFSYHDSNYYLIDTPGHIDFSPEMERSIQAMDYAIIVISAVEGMEGHTETVWELLRKHQVPVFFFINKIDRVGADVNKVIKDIQLNLTKDVCTITDSFTNGEMNEELVEFVAERSDVLLEHYMEHGYNHELWLNTFQEMIHDQNIIPLAYGSALQGVGVEEFLEQLDLLTVTDYRSLDPFAGRVYKIRHDENGTRFTFIKALSGTVKVRDEIQYGEMNTAEKVTQIRVYNGSHLQQVKQAEAGQLFAVAGLSETSVGDGVGALNEKTVYEMVPTLKSKVSFEQTVNIKEALRCFKLLDVEDPSLAVTWEESLQEIHLHVMGTIQLEVLVIVVKERFNLTVSFEKPEILYKESILTTVFGYGHFEPLGHYAEVHLHLQPGERNSGITFENRCHDDDLTVGHQNVIGQHLLERDHHGLLTGSPLTDIKVMLITGRAHNKHTSGGDFREASFRALRQGLEKADNILLEPYYSYKIKVDLHHIGRVLSDIQQAHGNFNPLETEGDKTVLTGRVPVAAFMDYSGQLAAFTKGKGTISLTFAGYDRCHNPKEVIDRIGYNKNADPDYSSSSIFCSKGQGYSVSWDEAEENMHGL